MGQGFVWLIHRRSLVSRATYQLVLDQNMDTNTKNLYEAIHYLERRSLTYPSSNGTLA